MFHFEQEQNEQIKVNDSPQAKAPTSIDAYVNF